MLDLSLPDASGFSLLETLSSDGDHGFPPVIVYTGHDLSAEDEQTPAPLFQLDHHQGRASRPSACSTRCRCSCTRWSPSCRPEQQKMIHKARNRDAVLEGRRILIVEDDVRNVYSLTSILEPRGAVVQIARNGQEALDALDRSASGRHRAPSTSC